MVQKGTVVTVPFLSIADKESAIRRWLYLSHGLTPTTEADFLLTA